MESTGAAFSPRATKTSVEPAPQTSYLMTPASLRPPRQAQPGMDALSANVDALAEPK